MKNRQVLMLGPSLNAKGGISSVVSMYQEHPFADWKLVYLPTYVDGSRTMKALAFLCALVRFLWANVTTPYELIHLHTASRTSFWRKSIFATLSIMLGRKYVLHLHGGEFVKFYRHECGRVRQAAIRYIFSRAAKVIVLSERWKQDLSAFVPGELLFLLHNPIRLHRLPENDGVRGKQLLFLGRLAKGKGIYDLIDAMVLILEKHPDCVLYACGDGDLQGVSHHCRKMGVEGAVKIVGWVAGDAKDAALSGSAIYVLPSYNEGLPMGILEAMAWKLPVVTTAVGGIPDAVQHQREGLLVSPGDVSGLAEAITEILGDEKLGCAMGAAGREKAETLFGVEKIIPKLEHLYEQIAG